MPVPNRTRAERREVLRSQSRAKGAVSAPAATPIYLRKLAALAPELRAHLVGLRGAAGDVPGVVADLAQAWAGRLVVAQSRYDRVAASLATLLANPGETSSAARSRRARDKERLRCRLEEARESLAQLRETGVALRACFMAALAAHKLHHDVRVDTPPSSIQVTMPEGSGAWFPVVVSPDPSPDPPEVAG